MPWTPRNTLPYSSHTHLVRGAYGQRGEHQRHRRAFEREQQTQQHVLRVVCGRERAQPQPQAVYAVAGGSAAPTPRPTPAVTRSAKSPELHRYWNPVRLEIDEKDYSQEGHRRQARGIKGTGGAAHKTPKRKKEAPPQLYPRTHSNQTAGRTPTGRHAAATPPLGFARATKPKQPRQPAGMMMYRAAEYTGR